MNKEDKTYTISEREMMELMNYRRIKATREIARNITQAGEELSSAIIGDIEHISTKLVGNKNQRPIPEIALHSYAIKYMLDILIGAADMFCREAYDIDKRTFSYPKRYENDPDKYDPKEARDYAVNILQIAADYIRDTKGEDIIINMVGGSISNE